MNPSGRNAAPCRNAGLGRCQVLAFLVIAVVSATSMPAVAQTLDPGCSFEHGSGEGPYDYRSQRTRLGIVEKRHFTPKVETLKGGQSTTHPGPDIHYTLNKFPNHHRALASLSRLGQKLQTPQVPDMPYSVVCYFERAIRFRPNDTTARLIYVRHLGRTNSVEAASRQLALAANDAKDNPLTHYKVGLVAFELKDYDTALKHAHVAYEAGVPLPELRDWLKKEGKWVEPASKGSPQASTTGRAASAPPTREMQ